MAPMLRYHVDQSQVTQYIGSYERDVENSSSPALSTIALDPGLEYWATFRFPVTWSYLIDTPPKVSKTAQERSLGVVNAPRTEPPPAEPALRTVPVVVPANTPAETLKPPEPRPSGPDAKWEMVIPKMARPMTARAPRALPHPQPVVAGPGGSPRPAAP